MKSLNDWAKEFWQVAEDHGFHEYGPTSNQGATNTPAVWAANIHGEVSEFWEAYRNGTLNEPCDKPIPLTCAEEELADIVIRTMEISVQLGLDIEKAIAAKNEYNKSRPWKHGGKKV